jgi:hypothetical protein
VQLNKQPKPAKSCDKQVKQYDPASDKPLIDPRYRAMTCYNCGELDHFVGICSRPKVASFVQSSAIT